MYATRIEPQYQLTFTESELKKLLDILELAFYQSPDDSDIERDAGKLTDVIEGVLNIYG